MVDLLRPQGQSTAKISNVNQGRVPLSQVAVGEPPRAPDNIAETLSGGSTLTYPSDRPKYYMMFEIFEYARQDLNTIGRLTPVSGVNQIIMPLSETLVNLHEAEWSEERLEWSTGAAVNWIIPRAREWFGGIGANGGRSLDGNNGDVGTQGNSLANNVLGTIGAVHPGAQIATGLSPNKFTTLLYIGPTYRRHVFNWNLSPSSPQESETLRRIHDAFNYAMAPEVFNAAIWRYPSVFKIQFFTEKARRYLYIFKPLVLESLAANFTPLNRASFYGGTEAIEGMALTLRFIELEYLVKNAPPGSVPLPTP
jgi:hypothetical protein